MSRILNSFILGILVVTLALSGFATAQTKDEENGKAYLYAAKIETASESSQSQQDEGILKAKSIRIINLGPIVNFKGLDYAPTVSADGKTLFYVSNRKGSKLTGDKEFSHDFWAAKKNDRLDTVFFTPYNIDTTTTWGKLGVNTELNEGAASIAADRQTLYFTGCNRPDGLGSCDIYVTKIEGDKWGKPTNLGKNVNSKYFDSQPSIDPYNTRLYFVSTRPGPNSDGKQELNRFDIWYSDRDPDTDEWSVAKNLEEINTKGSDCSPFISADNSTLFFSSDGRVPNIGGLDFYVTTFDADASKWSRPEILPEPINTKEDDQFISLPASGDILYFSSRRKDLPHYQGDLDVFMAFVPSFFRAINLKVYVLDECSGDNIPATITVRNPITGRTVVDSLTLNRTEFEMVISNTDYGNPRDSIKFVTLEISAENPKYGKTIKAQRIDKPRKTTKIEETKEFAGTIYDTLTLGQRPILEAEMAEAKYITDIKAQKPELASYRGLVMEQFQTWDLYPLLNYVFFDPGKADFLPRYILFNSPEETAGFTDTTIAGGTLDKYYHLLNIYGYRLTKNPDAKIEVVGCNDNTTADEKRPNLSKERATIVYNYFKNIWKIDESRMKLSFKNLPTVVSNLKDSLGIVENRRVEILSSDWEIMKPVFDKDPKTFPQPETMTFKMKNGIEDGLVTKRRIEINRGSAKWNVLQDVGITDPEEVWNWTNMDELYPKDEVPYTATLIVTTKNGKECKSDPVDIPVLQVSTEKKKVDRMKDSTIERYSLILFPFDRSDAGPINERIMRDYVYDRVKPSSKVEVIGHTDVVGLYDHNQALSERRANTVYTGIMKKTGGKFGEMTKRGVGEDEPLYNNVLPEERFYNRTVMVIIKTPTEEYEQK